MPKKKLTDIELLNQKAEELQTIRMRIKTAEERFKADTDADYLHEKELKEEMILGMKKVGIASVRVTAGDTYLISKTHDFVAKNPLEEDKYARENRCVSINKTLLKQRLRDELKKGTLPSWVSAVERETISIRAAKKEKEESSDSTDIFDETTDSG